MTRRPKFIIFRSTARGAVVIFAVFFIANWFVLDEFGWELSMDGVLVATLAGGTILEMLGRLKERLSSPEHVSEDKLEIQLFSGDAGLIFFGFFVLAILVFALDWFGWELWAYGVVVATLAGGTVLVLLGRRKERLSFPEHVSENTVGIDRLPDGPS